MLKIIAIFFFTQFLPTPVRSADDCAQNLPSVDGLLNLYKNSCSNQDPLKVCGCLQSQANNNTLVKSLVDSDVEFNTKKKEFQQLQVKKLFSIYSKMTYGEAYQKELLNISNNTVVGCTSTDLGKYFKDSVEAKESQNIESEEMNSGASLKEKIKRIEDKSTKDCAILTDILSQFINKKEEFRKSINKSIHGEGSESELINDLNEAKAWYIEHKDTGKEQEISNIIERIKASINSNDGTPKTNCPIFILDYQKMMGEFSKDVGLSNKEKSSIDQVVKKIDELNSQSVQNLAKNINQTPHNGCYTFSEWQILRSRPSDSLIKDLEANPFEINFFAPPVDNKSQTNKEKINFLRANPVLASTQTIACGKEELTSIMRDFAKTSKGLSEADKIKAYLNLMKSDRMTGLFKSREVSFARASNCEALGRNLAAVLASDEPPPLTEVRDSDSLTMLRDQVLNCKIKSKLETSKTNLSSTLNLNPLYLITENDPSDPSDTDKTEYESFLNTNCSGFENKRKNYISEKCQSSLDKGSCEKEYDLTSKSAPIREEFFKRFKRTSENGARAAVIKGANTNLNLENLKIISKVNNLDAQDKEIRKTFREKILPSIGKTVIAEKGEEIKFQKEQTQKMSRVEEVALSSSVSKTTVAEPNWTPTVLPPVTPSSLASAKIENFLPSDYSNQSPVQKLETLKSSREILKDEGQKLSEQSKTSSEKQQIITDLKKSIESMDAEVAKLKTQVDKVPSANQVMQNQMASTGSNVSGQNVVSNSGAGGNFFAAASGQASVSNNLKSARSVDNVKMDDALLKTKYLADPTGRSPASKKSDELKIAIGSSYSASLPINSQLLSQVPLDASSFGDKKLIMEKIKAEIDKKMVKSNEQVLIQFYDQANNEVLIVNVAWINNQWVVSQVPRKALLSNLSLTLIDQTH